MQKRLSVAPEKTTNSTSTTVASSNVKSAVVESDIVGENRKLNAQLRDGEKTLYKTKQEMRAAKAQHAVELAEKEAKLVATESNRKKLAMQVKTLQDKAKLQEVESVKKLAQELEMKQQTIENREKTVTHLQTSLQAAQNKLQQLKIDPISLQSIDAQAQSNELELNQQRDEFERKLQELHQVLDKREAAIQTELQKVVHLNNELESLN